MADEVVRLVNEVDFSRALAQQRAGEQEIQSSYGRMEGAARKVDAATAGIGASSVTAAKLGQRAMTAMSSAIGASTAAAAAGERQWLSLGTVILGSFAAGGPIAGGLALIGASIGLLSSSGSKAEASFLAQAQAVGKWSVALGQARTEAGATLDALQRVREKVPDLLERHGITGGWADMAQIVAEAKLRKMEGEIRTAGAESAGKMAQALAHEAEEFGRATTKAEEFAKALLVLDDLVKHGVIGQGVVTRISGPVNDAIERANLIDDFQRNADLQGLRDRNAGLAAGLGGGFRRASELAVEQSIANLEAQRALAVALNNRLEVAQITEKIELEQERLGIVQQQNDLTLSRLDRGVLREIELLGARNDQEREYIRLRHRTEDLTESGVSDSVVARFSAASAHAIAARPWNDLLRSAEQTLGQGLSDVIYDGIVNGFENASDIAQQVWQALLKSLINEFVASGIRGLFSGMGGGGGGGLFGILGGLFGGGGGGGGGGLAYGSGGGGLADLGGVFDPYGGTTFGGVDSSLGDAGGLIERMAEGGIATRPTIRMIGERGPEAVVPLHKAAGLGGGVSIGGITVNVSGGDVETAARLAAAKVYQAVRESGTMRSAVKDASRRGF